MNKGRDDLITLHKNLLQLYNILNKTKKKEWDRILPFSELLIERPNKTKFVKAIQEDVKWLGFDWGNQIFYASDYFDQLFEFAIRLIKKGTAYVDDLTPEQIQLKKIV